MSENTDADRERLRFLVGHKLSSLHTAGNVCMTWWVSSVVFSGTILAAVWLQRVELRNSPFMMGVLGFVLTAFFAGVAGFGYLVVKYLKDFKEDINKFPGRSKDTRLSRIEYGNFSSYLFKTELNFFIRGMQIGTICFVLIMVAWIVFWAGLMWFPCCNPPVPQK